ncbi:hypothetical protein D9M68_521550 [compost metagenome]
MVINQHAIGRVDADALHAEHVAGIRVTGIGQQLGGGEDIRHILGARRQRDRPADRRRVIAVADAEVEVGAGAEAAVGGGDAQLQAADLGIARGAAEGLRRRVEAQPARQWIAIGESGAVAEGVAIDIGEGASRHRETERAVLAGDLVGQCIGQGRCVIDGGYQDAQGVGAVSEGAAVADLEGDVGIGAAVAIRRRHEAQPAPVQVRPTDDLVENHRGPGAAIEQLQATGSRQSSNADGGQRGAFRVVVAAEIRGAQQHRGVFEGGQAVIGGGGRVVDAAADRSLEL